MEYCQDGTGLLWLEGEKDPHSSHLPAPPPGCRDAQTLHTIPRVYGKPAELRSLLQRLSLRDGDVRPFHFECMLHGMWIQAVRRPGF